MANTSFTIVSTAQGSDEKIQNTLTDINPAATNAQLKAFAQAFYGLSDDTYVDAIRIDKTDVDTEGGGGKAFRNITITGAAQGATATITANIVEGGTINPAVFYYTGNEVQLLTTTPAASDDATVAKVTVAIPNSSGTVFVGLTTGSNFYADFVSANVE